jgi:hypothetical protein
LKQCANGAETSKVFRSLGANKTTHPWKPMTTKVDERKPMQATMESIAGLNPRPLATAQKNSRELAPSTEDRSQKFDQPPIIQIFPWSNRDFDRPGMIYSPLNEW